MKNVPLNRFSWQGISFVASPVGSPVRLHLETTQYLNMDVAKIFVKADLTKDLPKKMNFNIQGQDILVEYTYLGLPSKGIKCGKWGHTPKMCLANKCERSEVQTDDEGMRLEESERVKEKSVGVVDHNLDITQDMVASNQNGVLEDENEMVERQIREVQRSENSEQVLEEVVVEGDELFMKNG